MTRQRSDAPRPPGFRRGVSALAVGLVTSAMACVPAAPAAAADSVAASQPLVSVLTNHAVRTKPSDNARRIETVSARRPLTRVRTVLPVLDETTDSDGDAWLRVRLPGRPNSHTGWIRGEQTKRTSTAWHIVVKLSTRRVTVYNGGRVVRRFSAVVGTRSTPTPRGRFFIEEAMSLSSKHAGAPFALATSARSNALQSYGGGPGQIALHGTRGLSGRPGTAASHGCIRLTTANITWMAGRLGAGVPLTIRR